MHIHFDINHPADVHYFKHIIAGLKLNGHSITLSARDKDVTHRLLDAYNLSFYNRGKGSNTLVGKILNLPFVNLNLLIQALKGIPDIFVSFSSPYAAQVACLLGKPHIALNDTEHTEGIHRKLTYPFSKAIITPAAYNGSFDKKHIRTNCVFEALYLHPKRFNPENSAALLNSAPEAKPYCILRLVSWHAFHDHGHKGLSLAVIKSIVELMKGSYDVYISSESPLPPELSSYNLNVTPDKMHDVLAGASLLISEGATMASEGALLGIPVVYVNPLPLMCYLKTEQEAGLLTHFSSTQGLIEHLASYMQNHELLSETKVKRDRMVADFIDPLPFLLWFIENWPQSYKIMCDNTLYQNKFK